MLWRASDLRSLIPRLAQSFSTPDPVRFQPVIVGAVVEGTQENSLAFRIEHGIRNVDDHLGFLERFLPDHGAIGWSDPCDPVTGPDKHLPFSAGLDETRRGVGRFSAECPPFLLSGIEIK